MLVVAGMNYEDLSRVPFFIDPRLKEELSAAGFSVGECRWSELTWEKLQRFDAVVYLQTPNLPSGEIEHGKLFAKMRELTARFLEAGGGVLIFPDLFRGRIEPTINALLKPYDLVVGSKELHVPPAAKKPFAAYPALGRTLSGPLSGHPAAGGATNVWLPIGSELSFALEPGKEWSALVRGPSGSWAEQTETSGGTRARDDKEPPVIAAIREVGPGRLAVFGSHSSFWVLNPYHEYWDDGAILREADGRKFLNGLLRWLAAVPAASKLGGFSGPDQSAIDNRDDRREKPAEQQASYPATARRGVIGLEPGPAASQVAALSAKARELGLDFVVFTPEASTIGGDDEWNALVNACKKASEGGFRAWPGAYFHSDETGNTGVAFNLKKRWPETPWRGDSFEAFVRVGVNNDWESVVALVSPAKAPFPYANLGAVTALASMSWDGTANTWLDAAKELREAISGGWKLMPIVYRPVQNADDLAAAAQQPTTLYTGNWPAPGGNHQRWDLASTGAGVIKHFSVKAGSTWEPADYSRTHAKLSVEKLPPGAVVELYCWHRLLRRGPSKDGKAEAEWEGLLPGAGMFWMQAVDANGKSIMQASPLAVAKITFSAFIGTDMMNGYWYPARRVAPTAANAVLLGGSYGQLGTSVYPQLGWGGHWQFRTLNQIGEPLGFEIGSPPGGVPKMTAGYRWPKGNTLPELAPVRTMGVNSTQAVVWNDRDTQLRRDQQIAGRRRLSVAPVPGVTSSMRTTGYRWWENAALHFEPEANFAATNASAPLEANLAAISLGDRAEDFTGVSVRQGDAESAHGMDETIPLPRGAGATLGDRPMGMVSVWSLADDLQLKITKDNGKPVLSLWQPGQAGAAQRTASFVLVISAHTPGRATTLTDVGSWMFDTAVWKNGSTDTTHFSETVDLAATHGEKGAWQGPGKRWRGRLLGLNPAWDAAVVRRDGERLDLKILPWTDPSGPTPALLDAVPEGSAFIGHPVIASKPGFVITLGAPESGAGAWRIIAHNSTARNEQAAFRTHPQLDGLAPPWTATESFAPGETKSWNYQP